MYDRIGNDFQGTLVNSWTPQLYASDILLVRIRHSFCKTNTVRWSGCVLRNPAVVYLFW